MSSEAKWWRTPARCARAALATLVCASAIACSDAHTIRDSGVDGGDPNDAGIHDGGPPDARPTDCERIDTFQRCDGRCTASDCPRGTRCVEALHVCLPPVTSGTSGCWMNEAVSDYCDSGGACQLTERGENLSGPCAPASLCLALAEAGLSPDCVWSDRTSVVSGPPPATCAAPDDARAPFCGGACEGVSCPSRPGGGGSVVNPSGGSTQCVGVSDTRGFGMCVWSATYCREPLDPEDPDEVAAWQYWQDLCREGYDGEPCACLVLEPQEGRQRGYYTLRTACLAYAAAHPGRASCREASWAIIE